MVLFETSFVAFSNKQKLSNSVIKLLNTLVFLLYAFLKNLNPIFTP